MLVERSFSLRGAWRSLCRLMGMLFLTSSTSLGSSFHRMIPSCSSVVATTEAHGSVIVE